MSDVVKLKYKIPKLDFKVMPSVVQTFSLYYRIHNSSTDDSRDWTTVTTAYSTDAYGNNTNDVTINDLYDSNGYQIKLVNNADTSSTPYIFYFKSGKTIALSDSPYYNKLLFPGQTFDWYINNLNVTNVPTTSDCDWYYRLNAKKSEVTNPDSWSNVVLMPVASGVDSWKYVNNTTVDGISAYNSQQGYYVTDGKYIALPNIKGDGTPVSYDYDGGITAKGILVDKAFNVGFGFYLEKYDATNGTTLCSIDNTNYKNSSAALYKYKIYVNGTGNLCVHQESAASNTFTDTNILSLNHWYYAVISSNGTSIKIYHITKDSSTATTTNATLLYTITSTITADGTEAELNGSSGKTPFCFGDANTSGLIINNIAGGIKITDYLDKVVNGDKYIPSLGLTFSIGGVDYFYHQPASLTATVTAERVSFIINPNIWTDFTSLSGKTNTDIDHIYADIYFDSIRYTNDTNHKLLPGLSIGSNTIGALVKNVDYKQDSFDVKFGSSITADAALTDIQKYFFTKHGTWGGFNGGTNGHLTYLDENNNLVLEAHGDLYKGSVKGIDKESNASTYTGYGTDLNLSLSWDTRPNKLCLRTGTALVSNKYFGYGEVSIWMRIPVGLLGVCPAIWLFHYIEVSETDARYNQAPYNLRNIQGSADDGRYRVVNNEIDLELPSHNVQHSFPSWSDVTGMYFDPNALDTKYTIGVQGSVLADSGTFKLNDITSPNVRASWVKPNPNSSDIQKRYQPSFRACKFNNWLGELNSGNGYAASKTAYEGKNDGTDTDKEEYLSLLTDIASNNNGYADGQWHKWTIKWLPTKTVLYIDDQKMRDNKCFIPNNQMKLTVAMWFPTMALGTTVNGKVKKVGSKEWSSATGVIDSDGIYGTAGALITSINSEKPIGTWAGNSANFEIAKLIINEIKYTKYNIGDVVEGYTITKDDIDNLYSLGESFPESGLRSFTTT